MKILRGLSKHQVLQRVGNRGASAVLSDKCRNGGVVTVFIFSNGTMFPGLPVAGVLWHQSESDPDAGTAPLYENNMRHQIQRLREEFSMSDLPVIIGQAGRFSAKPWTGRNNMVDKAQHHVAETTPHVYFVTSEGLLSKGDNLHFSTEAQRTFGAPHVKVYLKNEAKTKTAAAR